MTKIWKSGLIAGCVAVAAQGALAQDAGGEITIAYFLEWPMPYLAAKQSGAFDAAMGVKTNWVTFETGTAMSAAMAAGDVQIAVSQGMPPFVVAASAGQPIQVIDIAVSYSENDNCVVRTDLEIDKTTATEDLPGKKVAVPLGTAAHFGFLKQMDHFGVDLASLQIVDMAPPEGAAALAQGAVDMACGYGGGLTRMMEHGNVLLTGAEKEELGILVFDVISAPAAFIAENPELVAEFLKVTEQENARWNSGAGGDGMLKAMATESGMDFDAAQSAISTMEFPEFAAKLTDKWMYGGVATFMKGAADVFVEAGSIPAALDDYAPAVNVRPMEIAAGQ